MVLNMTAKPYLNYFLFSVWADVNHDALVELAEAAEARGWHFGSNSQFGVILDMGVKLWMVSEPLLRLLTGGIVRSMAVTYCLGLGADGREVQERRLVCRRDRTSQSVRGTDHRSRTGRTVRIDL
jgi:hypothetical protein